MHTYICWNILISQITGGKSPFFFSRWPPLPFRSSISRDRWKKPPSFLSRDPSNIGKMAATLVASVPQRPVQFSFLPFPVLLFSSPHPRPPPSGVKYRFWYFHRYSFFHLPPGSLSLFFIKWRTGCETRNFSPPSPSQRGAQFALEKT